MYSSTLSLHDALPIVLHGGSGDYKSMEPIARLFAGKFGHKAVAMTFPGRLYLDDPSRDWPGDTIHPDGSVRTPRSEEHTSELQSLMRISYAVFCLKTPKI